MVANVAGLLRAAAQEEPSRTALTEAATGRSLSWSDLDELVDATATGYAGAGLVAGQRVMIATGNRLEFVAAYLGALRARLVAVPVNPRSAAGEVSRMVEDCGARLVVADAGTVDLLREAGGAPLVVVDGAVAEGEGEGELAWADLVADRGRAVPAPEDPEALAVLLYTSGTSGRPRAAMLSHRALVANVQQVARVDPPMLRANDVVFGVLPLFHVYGLNAVLGQVLQQRARLVLVDRFDPEGALDIVDDEAVTVLPVAPPAFAYWRDAERARAEGSADGSADGLADRLGAVRLALSGSAPLAPELVTWFHDTTGIEVHQGYGLTEAAPVVTSTLCSRSRPEPGSVGAAVPGVELRLVDDAGRTPEGGDPGEIHVRGDNLFSGYWPDGADGPDAEGWWATGDVGFLDAGGDLYLVDRLKELVIVSGFNVYPSEVEEVVAETPGVAEVAVIGAPDEHTGEAVVAYVTPAADADAEALPDRVREHTASRLARFKQPSVVHVVDRLPYTVTGKVQKGRLRAAQRRATGLLE